MAYNSHSNTELFLQNEGILDKNEQFETVYLAEDEIEKLKIRDFIGKFFVKNYKLFAKLFFVGIEY